MALLDIMHWISDAYRKIDVALSHPALHSFECFLKACSFSKALFFGWWGCGKGGGGGSRKGGGIGCVGGYFYEVLCNFVVHVQGLSESKSLYIRAHFLSVRACRLITMLICHTVSFPRPNYSMSVKRLTSWTRY